MNIINKLREFIFVKRLYKSGIQLIPPYYISDIQHIKFSKPVYIGPGCWMELRGCLYIGSGTIIGPRLKVLTSNHNYMGSLLPYDDIYIVKDIHIHQNVWIGADVTILPGVEIGEGAVVAACSVVTKSVPPLAIVGGNPIKIIKHRDPIEYQKLKESGRIYLDYKRSGHTELDENKRIKHD